MSKTGLKSWLISPAVLGAMLWVGEGAIATPATQSQIPEPVTINTPAVVETSSVSELKDPPVTEEVDTQIPSLEIQEETPSSIFAQTPDDLSDTTLLEQINHYSNESEINSLDQVTNISQLRDVSPGDWAYEALRSLVERYGCIAGYPDGTYRGNRAMTRYEFAAGLNACLNQIERLIGTNTGGVNEGDLATLRRLIDEFQAELTTLGARVDNLEGRVGFLEDHQFSTTTKLNGTVIFALAGVATGENAFGDEIDNVTVFGDRVRLNLDTSFTGQDLLRTRLQALNLDSFSGSSTFTPEGDLRFADGTFGTDSGNDVEIDALLYQFPIGEKTTVVIEANAGAPDDFANTVNPYIDGDGDSGAISNFGTRNPIYGLVGGAGIGIRHQFSDAFELSLGYLAGDAANPGDDGGLFNGPYGAIAQLTIQPFDQLTLGLTYIHSYNSDLTAGSNLANFRSALTDNPALVDLASVIMPPTISSNSYGLQASLQISPKFVLGGWAGYTTTRILSPIFLGEFGRGDLNIWNWAVTLAFPDLGKEGSVAGIIVGMEPKVTRVKGDDFLEDFIGEDPDTSLHIEAFYQYQLTDNIAITPGLIWLTAPDHNNDNEDIVIGAIRTTFSF
ncbi:MAG TPA: porin [Cyanobacteria bacterium UBA12227]|nr:porin [Cyanobacteria bacterium UBA12227]HAX88528.1 porin [Cyanobacteria bacterium UBA11370]HBY75735.1 porin [Cyanobacteria bacterium UBA11148]